MWLKSFAALCFLSIPIFANSTPVERVEDYIAAFNSDQDMQEIGIEYWFPEMVINPGQQSPTHLSGAALAQQFEVLRTRLRETGWLRSEILGLDYCQLREDFALVSIRYVRVFKDGTKMPGAVLYTVMRDSSAWKISSINAIDYAKKLSCSGDDA